MKRVRKAVFAGLGATVTGLIAALVNGDAPVSPEGWAALVGGSLGLGVLTAFGTYAARNEGAGINPATGSEYPPPSRLHRP